MDEMRNTRARRTKGRTISIVALIGMIAGTLAITASTAGAVACQATDGTASSSNLQSIIDNALTGDRIVVRGTCFGNFQIPGAGSATNLTFVGYSQASLNGSASGSVITLGYSGLRGPAPSNLVVTFKDLQITNGSAQVGGGIYAYGTTTINLRGSTKVNDNAALSGGGGIFSYYGVVNMYGSSRVNDNTAGFKTANINTRGINGAGGGIFVLYGAVNMGPASRVNNNTAITGGGIFSYYSTLTGVTNANVKYNTPDQVFSVGV
jgi:hypothetical protein